MSLVKYGKRRLLFYVTIIYQWPWLEMEVFNPRFWGNIIFWINPLGRSYPPENKHGTPAKVLLGYFMLVPIGK